MHSKESGTHIPLWIDLINGIVLLILIFQIISVFVDPTWVFGNFQDVPDNRQVLLTLAGRNLVMIVVTVAGIFSRSVTWLKLIFLMNFSREFVDMLLMGYLQNFSMDGILRMSSFLIFLIPYVLAYRWLSRQSEG